MEQTSSGSNGRRLGVDRRTFSYDLCIPEKRLEDDRRSGYDRRTEDR